MFVFLICSERSGSNFVTSIIGGHPAVCAPPPTHLFRLFANNTANYGDLADEHHWHLMIEDLLANFHAKLGEWNTQMDPSELMRRAQNRSAAELLRIIYRREAAEEGATRIFVKENQTYSFAPFLLAHFPDCRFVYMVRDPRDVAASWVTTDTISGGVAKAVETWNRDQQGAWSLYQQIRTSGRIRLVRYEDLVSDTEVCLRQLTGFIDLPYDPQMLEFYRHPRTARNAQRIEAWGNLARPVMQGNSGKYRDVLSQEDVRYVELRCFEAMDTFGYARDLIGELPEPEIRMAQVDELEARVSPGSYAVRNAQEREIRARRTAALGRVLQRRL